MTEREYKITGGRKEEIFVLRVVEIKKYFERLKWKTSDAEERKFLICLEHAAIDGIGSSTIKEK